MSMLLKVCGLKEVENIREVAQLGVDMIGLNFYSASPRFVNGLSAEVVRRLDVEKAGVFVNATREVILEQVENYGLDYVQLHGDERRELGEQLSEQVSVIKVFRVGESAMENLEDHTYARYFLFDTKTVNYGGSGQQFDWSVLSDVERPFFLSGGISESDVPAIYRLGLNYLVGLDVNSKFELAPGVKDIERLKKLKALL
jgi:phosphoribosylanthranilate isomerase